MPFNRCNSIDCIYWCCKNNSNNLLHSWTVKRNNLRILQRNSKFYKYIEMVECNKENVKL